MANIVEIKARLFQIQREVLQACKDVEQEDFTNVFDRFSTIEEHAQKGQAECLD